MACRNSIGERGFVDKKIIATTVAGLFAAAAMTGAAHAQSTNKCYGINSCKGQSACASYRTSCKGKNSCKGKGIVITSTTLECVATGGAPTP